MLRRSARVLLVDPAGRVLLLRLRRPADGQADRIVPGGGIEPGESPAGAACRELVEELGLVLAPEQLAGPVWRQRALLPTKPGWDGVDSLYLFARVAADVVPDRTATAAEWELEEIADTAWWDPARMRAAADTVFSPRALSDLLEALLTDGLPDAPVPRGL